MSEIKKKCKLQIKSNITTWSSKVCFTHQNKINAIFGKFPPFLTRFLVTPNFDEFWSFLTFPSPCDWRNNLGMYGSVLSAEGVNLWKRCYLEAGYFIRITSEWHHYPGNMFLRRTQYAKVWASWQYHVEVLDIHTGTYHNSSRACFGKQRLQKRE